VDHDPGFEWRTITSSDLFANRRVALFGVPGAFTPTCSSTHLPGYSMHYSELLELGIDEVYCVSVNDTFVMNAWFNQLGITNVKPIPDGSADFTRQLGMLVKKDNLGFGQRSWRYSLIADNGVVEKMWIEPGYQDDSELDPFQVSDVNTMMNWLRNQSK
jgi:peroxiredoxin